MRTPSTLYGALLLAMAGSAPGQSAAADRFGSYAADGACHCIGRPEPRLAGRTVPTPIGGQSVAQVCERVGAGPGLTFPDGEFDHTVYPDAQCGNGPFAAGTTLLDTTCAGTRTPGGNDCRPVGPRWDLQLAYAQPLAEAVSVPGDAPPEQILVLANAGDAAGRTVVIDGIDWRPAPAGIEPNGGAAGSRIILDGALWLRADDPAFEAAAKLAEARQARAQRAPQTSAAPLSNVATAAPVPVETTESLQERQRRLVADARARASRRAADEVAAEEVATALQPTIVPTVAPVTGGDAIADAATGTDDEVEPTLAAAAPQDDARDERDERGVEAVAESTATATDDDAVAAPLSALRLPIDARASSSDFGYVQAMPISYDIGGAGVMLEGAAEVNNRYHLVARAGVASKYQEVLLGAGVHYTPPNADRLTLLMTGGVEYGVFPLENVETGLQVDDASTGLFLTAAGRLVLNPRFELEGGLGYSSFHEGDPIAFGGGFFHVNDTVDLMSRFELGDQDSYGIGVRIYY